jgi:transmembrane sensor
MKPTDEIINLLAKSVGNQLTIAEKDQLNIWLNQSEENKLLYRLYKEDYQHGEQEEINDVDSNRGWQLISGKIHRGIKVAPATWHVNKRLLYFTAAATLMVLVALVYLLVRYEQGVDKKAVFVVNQVSSATIPPGTNKATLLLADGSKITLDKMASGRIAVQGNTSIVQENSGQLTYQTSGEKPLNLVYNTLVTPVGGQYAIVLPDGSRVWLNAASSLRFPATFTGPERMVELTGEAYFEVAHNSQKAFKVQVLRQHEKVLVEVLGTHFNINSYSNETVINTTLLQGSIKLHNSGQTWLLNPGQQANSTGQNTVVSAADTIQAVAWKQGDFYFNKTNIRKIMNQFERWYNIRVVYQNNQPLGDYTGNISRNNDLLTVLQMLQQAGLECKLQDRILIVGK